jgi:2-dehydropantoate 2-reductase
MSIRIGIVGLGAVGSAVAARLLSSRGDRERFGLAAGTEARAAKIRESGFSLRDAQGEQRAKAWLEVGSGHGETEPRDRLGPELPRFSDGGQYQWILLCTRAEQTDTALDAILPLLAPEGAILCLQNGLPEGRVAARAGQERTLGAVIGWSASSAGPGQSALTGAGKFILGSNDLGGRRHLEEARALLARCFPTEVTKNLAGARWSKLALNCAVSTLGAISGLSFGQLANRRDARALALRVIDEVVAVGEAQGVELSRVSGLDPRWLGDDGSDRAARSLARPLQHLLFWLAARQRPAQRSGMLGRLLAGRTSGQIDDLNGAVLAEARGSGISVPLNEKLVALVHQIERGEAKIDPANLARVSRR